MDEMSKVILSNKLAALQARVAKVRPRRSRRHGRGNWRLTVVLGRHKSPFVRGMRPVPPRL